MKKKYLIIVISIIAAIAIGIKCSPILREKKSHYEYSLMVENVNKAFEEMVAFCEENQKEIEAYSIRHLALAQPDMSYEERMKMEKQIMEELDCKWMFENISVSYNMDLDGTEGIALYEYKRFNYVDLDGVENPSTIEIFYFEKGISQQDFEEMHFFEDPYILKDIKKINAHLYVCVRGRMCL